MTPLNKAQVTCMQTYGGGDYAPYLAGDLGWSRSWEAVRYGLLPTCGDGLFRFLMIELSSGEDCDSIESAIRRCQAAEEQIAEVRAALEKLEAGA